MTMAALGASRVVATEATGSAFDALCASIARNQDCWRRDAAHETAPRCEPTLCPLNWGKDEEARLLNDGSAFDVVVCADLIYSRALHTPLLRTLSSVITPNATTVVIALERRSDCEESFLHALSREMDMQVCHVYGPDDAAVEIHVARHRTLQ